MDRHHHSSIVLGLALMACAGEDPAATGNARQPPPIDAARAASDLHLQDDFSDPASGFTVRENSTYRNAYQDGVYVVWVDNAASPYVTNVASRPEEYSDVTVEVDATKRGGSPAATIGLECRRATGQAGTYFADVDAEGSIRIGAHGDEQEILAEAERPGLWREGANRLRLNCLGDELVFWLNGERLLAVTDRRYDRGRIGVRAGGSSGQATEVAFDDLLVVVPGADVVR
jgi:hypothetical protein